MNDKVALVTGTSAGIDLSSIYGLVGAPRAAGCPGWAPLTGVIPRPTSRPWRTRCSVAARRGRSRDRPGGSVNPVFAPEPNRGYRVADARIEVVEPR